MMELGMHELLPLSQVTRVSFEHCPSMHCSEWGLDTCAQHRAVN